MSSPQGADAPMLSDAFMAFRLLMNYLDDLATVIEPSTGRIRANVEAGSLTSVGTVFSVNSVGTVTSVTSVGTVTTVTDVLALENIVNIGSFPARGLMFESMDGLFVAAIRPQVV